MTQIQLYTSLTAKLDGLNLTGNLSRCSLAVKYPSGTFLELDLQGQPLRPSEVERLVQSLLLTSSNSPWKSFEHLLDDDSVPSSVTTSVVRLHKSLSLGESDAAPSSVSVILPTTEYDELNQGSGG